MVNAGSARNSRQNELDDIFKRAHEQWRTGKLGSAFRLLLQGAKGGDAAAQLTLGNFYCDGVGIKPNIATALYWYRRAYRRGYMPAANNIAVVFRNEGKLAKALAWFERAVDLGDADANLEIAKIYLANNERSKAVRYLKRVCKAKPDAVTEASREEAESRLKGL